MARVVLVLGCALAAADPAAPRQLRGLAANGTVPTRSPEVQVLPVANGTNCTNSYGIAFTCAADSACCGDSCLGSGGACCQSSTGGSFSCGENSSCCGDTCIAPGGTCCTNEMGDTFACESGSKCCGNTCVAKQDKCCTDARGTKYGVTGGSPCISEMKNCTNRHGGIFWCGEGSDCCGDVCMAPGAVCCQGLPGVGAFSCAQHSQCCGGVCAAPGSMCCKDSLGNQYPVVATYVYPWDNRTYANCGPRV